MKFSNRESQTVVSCQRCDKRIIGDAKIDQYMDGIWHPKCYKAETMEMNGFPHECPECHGKGSKVKMIPSWRSAEGEPDSPRDVECNLCEGRGYLKTEPKVNVTVTYSRG